MEKHAQQFYDEIEKSRDLLTDSELIYVNFAFLGGLVSYLHLSKDGKISVDEIIKSYNIAVEFRLVQRDKTQKN